MNPKLQNKLFRKYPHIFQDRKKPGSETRMCDGIACGDGWYELISNVCEELELIRKQLGVKVSFCQIKEKLAGLRIYINRPEEISKPCDEFGSSYSFTLKQKKTIERIIHNVVHYAMCQSYVTCEECGGSRYGTRKSGAWLYAMCDKCWAKFLKSKGIKVKKNKY